METKSGDSKGVEELSGKLIENATGIQSQKQTGLPPPSTPVSDPDEDDLDDLDDMLDEFSPSKPEAKVAEPPSHARTQEASEEGLSDEEFAKQLSAGMADLLGGLDSSPDVQVKLADILKELGNVVNTNESVPPVGSSGSTKELPNSTTVPATTGGGTVIEESFQETIKKTMERMRTSGDQATAAATSSDNSDDLLAEMMKAMQASGLGEGEGGEEDFSKMLLGMMEQLTNKEILYEPMKELHDKFPDWMKKNEGKVKEEDWKRYKEQQVYVREIVDRFERKEYNDENAADREYIVERMQKMQAAGSPPPDLVGDMEAAQEAFGAPEEGCPQQ